MLILWDSKKKKFFSEFFQMILHKNYMPIHFIISLSLAFVSIFNDLFLKVYKSPNFPIITKSILFRKKLPLVGAHSRAETKNYRNLTMWMYYKMKKLYRFQRPRECWIQSWNCLISSRLNTNDYFVTNFCSEICLLFFHSISVLANLANLGKCLKWAAVTSEPYSKLHNFFRSQPLA